MIALAVHTLAALYSFPWLRIPDVMGFALPFQRLVGWSGVALVFVAVCLRGRFRANRSARTYLALLSLFVVVMLIGFARHAGFNPTFNRLTFLMEFSKYVAVFGAGFLVYYALEHRLVSEGRLLRLVTLSGAACIVVAYGLLLLYWAGFRTTNEILANSFDGPLGVWPTSGFFPRLAGPTAEPQQFSVVFVTALMLMFNRQNIRRYGWLGLLGVVALLLSQSKFAFVSLAALALYLDIIYKKHRLIFGALAVLSLPLLLATVGSLPTFATTFQQGFEARAITERLENAGVLVDAIQNHFLVGIGTGQFGTYRGVLMFDDPNYLPTYTPGNDLMTLFAETGVFGFALVAGLFMLLFWRFTTLLPLLTLAERERYLPFLIGAVVIVANMVIGYEFLHAFFWVNMGMLMYMHQHYRARHRASAQVPTEQPRAALELEPA